MIKIEPGLNVIYRKTDNILDLLSDWGGLLYALNIIGKQVLSPYSAYALQYLLSFFLRIHVTKPLSSPPSIIKETEYYLLIFRSEFHT